MGDPNVQSVCECEVTTFTDNEILAKACEVHRKLCDIFNADLGTLPLAAIAIAISQLARQQPLLRKQLLVLMENG